MQKAKNVVSKMSLAAIKAWETRRQHAKEQSNVSLKKKVEKKNGKKAVKADHFERKELDKLNGKDLDLMAKQTQRKLDRKAKMEQAKNGKREEVRSVEVGNIIKQSKVKVERFNGGVKLSRTC